MNDEIPKPVVPEILEPAYSRVEPQPRSVRVVRRRPTRRIALVLFLLTCASTFYAGTDQFPGHIIVTDPVSGKEMLVGKFDQKTRTFIPETVWRQTFFNGLTYATAVMVMLGAH